MIYLTIVGCIVLFIFLLYIDYILGKMLSARNNHSMKWNTSSDDVTFFDSGQDLFEKMLKDIENAKTSIDVQFFIIRNDQISNRFYSLLAQKHAEGVEVRMLADWVGSFRYRKKWIKNRFPFFKMNHPRPPFFYHLQQRNHRKLLIIDQKIGYLGGFNLGEEYLGNDLKLGKWKDYHIRLTGEIARVFSQIFTTDWNKASLSYDRSFGEKEAKAEDVNICVMTSEANSLEKSILSMLSSAKRSIEIGSPYFIPTKPVLQALVDARKRGVKITILLPEKGDHPITKAGAMPYLKKMQEIGVDTYLYMDGFFHGKVLFIDEEICDFGTGNFDQRSLLLNEEINVIVKKDHPLYQDARACFTHDLNTSKKLTLTWIKHQPLWMKLLTVISVPLRRFL